jgi:hypothetical protein
MHVEWNSRLFTERCRLLTDYGDKNSCLVYGPNTPATTPYTIDIAIRKYLTPNVHDRVVRTELVSLAYIDTQCR